MRKPLIIVFLVDVVFIGLLVILTPFPLRPRILYSQFGISFIFMVINAAVYHIVLREKSNKAAIKGFIVLVVAMFFVAYVFDVLLEYDKDYRNTEYFEKYNKKYQLTIYKNCDYFFISDITSVNSNNNILFDRYAKHNDTIFLGDNFAKLIKHNILIDFPNKKDTIILTHPSLNDFMYVKDSIVLTR